MANFITNSINSIKNTQLISLVLLTAFFLLFLTSCAAVGFGAVGGVILASEERRLPGQIVNDQLLEYHVNEAVYAELRNQADIEVISYNGVVLLIGEANSQTSIQRIVDLVHIYARDNVEVVNELMIGQPTAFSESTKDAILTAKVKSVLFAEIADKQAQNLSESENIDYAALNIATKIVSHRSTVYLLGILTEAEQDFIKSIVSKVKGVRKVVSVFQDWDKLQEDQRAQIGKLRQEQMSKQTIDKQHY